MSVPNLEPASSKDNEILEINVLQKFTSHSLLISILAVFNLLLSKSLYGVQVSSFLKA